ncbi:MAG: ubiquinol-cytochrome c reductase iron-sulfur subunit [Acidobacteria bacterium]|jgi:Rieske Fe-S protein|nr:ubiquinol-cytochrome c reductase iron-sulfur subunit [Acidobacteriota bacterium]
MAHTSETPPSGERRRALAIFVNTVVALIGGGLSAVLGAFAFGPRAGAAQGRWSRAGTTDDLKPDEPVARVLSVSRVDGWYRARARETVFLVWDGDKAIRAMSATCTHLGCQVRWEAKDKKFRCPCHGGVYAADGTVLEGPPPRPLQTVEARIDPSDSSVLVRL